MIKPGSHDQKISILISGDKMTELQLHSWMIFALPTSTALAQVTANSTVIRGNATRRQKRKISITLR